MKRLLLLLVAALALLVPVVGQAASGPVLSFYAPNTTTPPITTFDFGAVLPGQSVSKTFPLKNTGGSATAALKITLTPSAGTPAAAFTKTGDTCSLPVPISLGKGKTCQITIRFTPVAGGESDAADLTAVSKKPNATKTLHLTGSGRVESDLSLDLTRALTSDLDGNGQNSIGDRVTFTLTLDNAGPDAAASVHVADLLPAGYVFLPFSAIASQGTYNTATGDWNVGAVSVASTPNLQFRATVVGGKPVGAYTNYAQVSASGSFDPDSTPADDSTTEDDDASVTPPIADLSATNAWALIADVDQSGSLTLGDVVRFTLTVSNAGPGPAPQVRLVDFLPSGPPFFNGFTYGGDDGLGTYDPATGIWTVGDMAPGTTQTLNITATVLSTGPYINIVQVWAFGFAEPFPGSEINEYLDPDSTANNGVPTEDDQASVTPGA